MRRMILVVATIVLACGCDSADDARSDTTNVQPPVDTTPEGNDATYESETANIWFAAARGHIDDLKHFLASDDVFVNELDEHGFAPLHKAAQHGKVDAAKVLLDAEADVNVAQGRFHGTPLQYAASNDRIEVVKLLLEYEADPNAKDTQGRTPLNWAEAKGFNAIAEVLRPVTNESTGMAKPADGLTLLDAIKRWPAANVAQLLQEGRELPPPPEKGPTAFQQAAHRGDLDIVKILIPLVKDIDERDDLQRTAVIWASLRGNTMVIQELAKHKADLNAKSTGNWTALHFAIRQGHQETAQTLIDLGADPTAELDNGGKTPLDMDPNMALKLRQK